MRFFYLINTKAASVICILISVACRITNILFASFTGRDKIFLALQSKSFLNGKGFGIPKYFITDITAPVYDLTPMWPPGYPVLLAPFLKLFNYDLSAATATIDIIGGVALIFIVRRIVVELRFPSIAVNLATLIAGCFEYSFISEALPTDIPAFVFFLCGLLFLLKAAQNEKSQTSKLIIASLLLFMSCVFRYSYPPLCIAAPVAVIFMGWYLKKGILIKKGAISLTIISLLLLIFFIGLKMFTGKTSYVVDTGKGFYLENILYCAPVVPASFINTFFATSQLIDKTGLSLAKSMLLLEIINALMIAGILFLAAYLFFVKKFFRQSDPFKSFLLVGFLISAATFVSLAYLSVSYKPQTGFGHGWNYLNEPRYFMFVNIFLQVAFLGSVFIYQSWKKNIFQKIIVLVLSLLLFIEVAHNIYFHAKVVINPGKYQVAAYEEPDYTYFTHALDSLSRDNADAEFLIVADGDDFFPMMAAYLEHKGLYDGYNMIKALPVIKRKTIIIIALYDQEIAGYQQFLSAQKAQLLNRINHVNFYRIDLRP